MCTINGKTYKSDCARLIRKFDIYLCDLGEVGEGLCLGKTRPCVIIQSNRMNHPLQNGYIVAPIRTEHEFKVSKDTLQEIVDYRKSLGRIYIPIEDEPEKYRFIDITETRKVASAKVLRYKNTIINPELRQKIDDALFELLLDDDAYNVDIAPFGMSIDSMGETKKIETPALSEEPVADTEINQKIAKAISEQEEAIKQRVTEVHKKFHKKEISKSEAAKQLGISIKDFDKISQEIKKEEKEEKKATTKTSKYANRPLPKKLPLGFSLLYKEYKEGNITVKEITQRLGKSEQTIYNYIARYEQLQNENKVTSV